MGSTLAINIISVVTRQVFKRDFFHPPATNMSNSKNDNKASINGKPILTKGKTNGASEEKNPKSVVLQEPQPSPVVQNEEKRICKICGKDSTAKRMNGKPRWHLYAMTEADGYVCHRCHEADRKELARND